MRNFRVHCCFTSTEIVRTIGDVTTTSIFTQLLRKVRKRRKEAVGVDRVWDKWLTHQGGIVGGGVGG